MIGRRLLAPDSPYASNRIAASCGRDALTNRFGKHFRQVAMQTAPVKPGRTCTVVQFAS